MRDLIYDGGPIQAAFIANDDATALTLLNTPTEKVVVHAMVDIDVIVEAESESFAGDFVRSMNTRVAALNASANEEDKRLAAILQVYVTQLSSGGIDLTRNKVRSKVADALQAQGWNLNKRNRVLDLGYVMKSKPEVEYRRIATQADIDQVRSENVVNALRTEYDAAFNKFVVVSMDAGGRAGIVAGLRSMADEIEVG